MSKVLTHSDLRQFTGSERWFRHSTLRKILYTEGVQYLVEKGEAYWLLDKIAANQLEPKIRAEEFQVWKLKVNENCTGTVTAEDGDGNVIHSEDIRWTDFPLDQVELWVEGNTILLPSEH
jgi:hypothetical protein